MTMQNEHLLSTEDRREVLAKLEQIAPDFVSMISQFCLTQVYDRPGLEDKMKEVVAIVSLISLGSARLRGHLESALENGFSREELVEVIMLSSIYLGFPRAIDALLVLHQLTETPEQTEAGSNCKR